MTYESTLAVLNTHFSIKKNVPFERSKFHQAKQEASVSVEQYITRLRTLSFYCEYTDVNFIVSYKSTKLRKRLLTEPDMTLDRIVEISRARESAQEHAKQIEETSEGSFPQTVNRMDRMAQNRSNNHNRPNNRHHQNHSDNRHHQNRSDNRHQTNKQFPTSPLICSRCGAQGHKGGDCRRSKNAKCNNCSKIGHFQKMCRSSKPNKFNCNQIDNSSSESSDDGFTFNFQSKSLKSAGLHLTSNQKA